MSELAEIPADKLLAIRSEIQKLTEKAETLEYRKFPLFGLLAPRTVKVPRELLEAAIKYHGTLLKHVEDLSELPDRHLSPICSPLNPGLIDKFQKKGRGRPRKTKAGGLLADFLKQTKQKRGRPGNSLSGESLLRLVDHAKQELNIKTDKAAVIHLIMKLHGENGKPISRLRAEKKARPLLIKLSKARTAEKGEVYKSLKCK